MFEMEWIGQFADYMRNVKNRSELTITAYCADLAQFCAVMCAKGSFGEVTRKEIETVYIANLAGMGVSAASRARKLSSLKAFYKWAMSNEFVKTNPVEYVDAPKIPHKEPKVMSTNEVKQVMLELRRKSNKSESLFRDMALLTLLFNTGLRRAEVVNIRLSDVDLENASLLVHGKGNKERIVYYNNTTRSILSEYINSHRKLFSYAKDSEYLFVSQQRGKISVETVNNIVNRHFESAGLKEKGYTAHSTRRTFATNVYENTHNLMAVQNLLGHSSPTTTQRYIGISEMSKKQVAMTVNF